MTRPVTLPEHLQSKVLSFPEYRMGAHRVALVLRGGEIIDDVIIAWGNEIVRVGQNAVVDLDPADIVDVLDGSGLEE